MTFGVTGIRVEIDGVVALAGVDLDVPDGSVVAVVGGDGAGKSTLLSCLVGLVEPSEGRVRRPDRHRVGYMPSTSGVWRDLTVDENIEFVGKVFGMRPAEIAEQRAVLLERARLTGATDRQAGALSGGMRQKLGFVLAMLHRPDLLVLDEPSTGVDPVSRVELWRLIAEAAASGTAVAMATTYLDEAERATLITVLDGGRAIASGTRDQVIADTPGVVISVDRATVPGRSWRRNGGIRQWVAAGEPVSGHVVGVDELEFEDVVIARLLAERSRRATTGERR